MPLDLAALLVEARAVSAEDMERALQRQRIAGGALDTAILELELVAEPELARFLSRVSGLPVAQLAEDEPDVRASRVFPLGIAQRHRMAPFRFDGRALSLLTTHPVDRAALADLGVMLSMQLVPHVAPAWRVFELLQSLYGAPMPAREAQVAARLRGVGGGAGAGPGGASDAAPPAGATAPSWRLVRADPEEPLATAVARAAETLDATEILSDVLEPDPVPEEPPRWTLAQAAAAMEAAPDRDAVVAAALRHARDFLEAAALFAVSRDAVTGVDAVGWARARQRCRSVRLQGREAGLFRAAIDARGPYLGPLAREPANEHLLQGLGRRWPAVVLAYPIVVGDRVACVLYGDNGDAPVSPRRIGDLLLFAGGVGTALQRVLREAKGAHRGPPPVAAEGAGGWTVHEPARGRAADAAPGAAAPEEPFRIVSAPRAVGGAQASQREEE